MSGSAGQFKFCVKYFAFSWDRVGMGPELLVLFKDAILASSTGMNILEAVSEACPNSMVGLTHTWYGLVLVMTTNITLCLSTFVSDSSRITPGMSSDRVVRIVDPGCKNEPSSVVSKHFILVW